MKTLSEYFKQQSNTSSVHQITATNFKERLQLTQILEIWMLQAKSRMRELPETSTSLYENFNAQHAICDQLRDQIRNQNDSKLLFVSKNTEEKVQAVMMLDPSEANLEIDFIVTSPENIDQLENKDPSKPRLGSQMIETACSVAAVLNKPIVQLTPVSSSKEFYRKNGFDSPYPDSSKMFKVVRN